MAPGCACGGGSAQKGGALIALCPRPPCKADRSTPPRRTPSGWKAQRWQHLVSLEPAASLAPLSQAAPGKASCSRLPDRLLAGSLPLSGFERTQNTLHSGALAGTFSASTTPSRTPSRLWLPTQHGAAPPWLALCMKGKEKCPRLSPHQNLARFCEKDSATLSSASATWGSAPFTRPATMETAVNDSPKHKNRPERDRERGSPR